MISSLRGKIIHQDNKNGFVVIEVSGIGYRIYLPTPLFLKLKKNEDVFLFTHEHVREDTRDLFGFETSDELIFFEKLIGISGVGPKMGLNILSLGKIAELKKAIEKGDINFLTDLKGVGKKIAQKIILELKGKLVDGESVELNDEVVDALKNLGYSPKEARAAILKIPKNLKTTELRLMESLKHLAR